MLCDELPAAGTVLGAVHANVPDTLAVPPVSMAFANVCCAVRTVDVVGATLMVALTVATPVVYVVGEYGWAEGSDDWMPHFHAKYPSTSCFCRVVRATL